MCHHRGGEPHPQLQSPKKLDRDKVERRTSDGALRSVRDLRHGQAPGAEGQVMAGAQEARPKFVRRRAARYPRDVEHRVLVPCQGPPE